MDHRGETEGRKEPVVLSLACFLFAHFKAHTTPEEAYRPMPYREQNPFPEDGHIEIFAFLACSVDDRVFVAVLIVDILFEDEGKEALPGGPGGVVEHREPVGEEYLAAVSIEKSEINFSKN
jgi:hypothetical protein